MAIKLSNYAVIDYNMLYIFKIIEALLDKRDHGNQQNPPFSKLHIKLLELFKGSRSLSNPWFSLVRITKASSLAWLLNLLVPTNK
jgi:hypothetical protein